METKMKKLPRNSEELIGSPQILSRTILLDGKTLLVRLQRPFFEKSEEDGPSLDFYETAICIDVWSDATKSVMTFGITKSADQTEELFTFGARCMLNNSSDKEIIEVLRIKRIDQMIKFATGSVEKTLMLPSPPNSGKKAK